MTLPDEGYSHPPRVLTPTVIGFCHEVVPGESPHYVPLGPYESKDPLECFDAVARWVSEHGGSRLLGWRIWECPQVYIEAELHAVWRAIDGDLLDVSYLYERRGRTRMLFVADPSRVWEGQPIDNVRRALDPDPVVRRFLECGRLKFDALRGKPKGPVSFPVEEAEKFMLSPEEAEAFSEIVWSRRRRNDPCVCGSISKFKQCHGRT